jgi:hypothetical protein
MLPKLSPGVRHSSSLKVGSSILTQKPYLNFPYAFNNQSPFMIKSQKLPDPVIEALQEQLEEHHLEEGFKFGFK